MITITITECKSGGQTWTSSHRAEDTWQAVERAVRKVWGRRAAFVRDNGLSVGRTPADGTQYGQIGVDARGGGQDLITGRVKISAD